MIEKNLLSEKVTNNLITHFKTIQIQLQTIIITMDKPATSFKSFIQLQDSLIILPRIKQATKPTKINNYLIGPIIGKGGFATVYQAFNSSTKTEVAVKIIDISSLHQKDKHHLIEEVSIAKIIDHPHIVKCIQILQRQNFIFIFMQLLKGKQLYNLIIEKNHLSERIAMKIFQQISFAVQYLHKLGIYHRDIKAENIMIDENCNAKLIDFGLAKRDKKNELQITLCGSFPYKSPQILSNNFYSGKKNDIWSLGVLLFCMIEGKYPFEVDKFMDSSSIDIHQNFEEAYKNKIKFSSKHSLQIYKKIFVTERKRTDITSLVLFIEEKNAFLDKRRLLNTKSQNKDSTRNNFERFNELISIRGKQVYKMFTVSNQRTEEYFSIEKEKEKNRGRNSRKSTNFYTQRGQQKKGIQPLLGSSLVIKDLRKKRMKTQNFQDKDEKNQKRRKRLSLIPYN